MMNLNKLLTKILFVIKASFLNISFKDDRSPMTVSQEVMNISQTVKNYENVDFAKTRLSSKYISGNSRLESIQLLSD